MTMATTNHEKRSSNVDLVDCQQQSLQIDFDAIAQEITHSWAACFHLPINITLPPTQTMKTMMMTMQMTATTIKTMTATTMVAMAMTKSPPLDGQGPHMPHSPQQNQQPTNLPTNDQQQPHTCNDDGSADDDNSDDNGISTDDTASLDHHDPHTLH